VIRTAVRGTGELLITAGLVVLLFVAYQLVWTNYEAHKATDSVASDLRDSWDRPNPSGAGPAAARGPKKVDFGKGFAFLHIPRLGKNWTIPVVEGVDLPDLAKGVGHYPKTAQPGAIGNFAVAGHRVSKGSPFNDLGLLASCDAIVVETQDDWFVYRVLPMADEVATWTTTQRAHCDGVGVQTGAYDGVYGREITLPTDYAQVLPVPHVDSTAIPADAQRMITLTSNVSGGVER